MWVCKIAKSTCSLAPKSAFSGCNHYMEGPPGRTWDLRKPPARLQMLSPASLLLLHSCFASPGPRFMASIHAQTLSSALRGLRWRSLVTQGLHSKFPLSTLDLIAAINTNYASLSMKLKRTRLGGSCSIQGWRTNGTAIFNPGHVSRERAAWHCMCRPRLLQIEFFTFSNKYLLFSAQGVWQR